VKAFLLLDSAKVYLMGEKSLYGFPLGRNAMVNRTMVSRHWGERGKEVCKCFLVLCLWPIPHSKRPVVLERMMYSCGGKGRLNSSFFFASVYYPLSQRCKHG
jgi:hypothetical protein